MTEEPTCIWPAGAALGEGAVWHPEEQRLYWVDIKAPAVHRFDPSTGERRSWPMPSQIGCLAPRRAGGFVAALQSGFVFLDLEANRIEPIANPEPEQPGNRFNDGKCDRKGRFWAGSMDDAVVAATGWLYRLDQDLSWHRMDGPYACTNGPAMSPDGSVLYHTDTVGRVIYAFDSSADGSLSNKRPFVRFQEREGYPDGMTVDADGHLWVAHWGGGCVTRFRPDGTRERRISLPASQVTCPTFGGPDMTTLYITTAATGLSPVERQSQPLAGGLFAVETGIVGLPCNFFVG